MTFTIGRASFATGPLIGSLQQSGDRVSFAIDISPVTTSGSVAHAKVLRQQVLGLADNADEPVVPVTWSDDSTWDGFYRVVGTSVDPGPVHLSNGFMRCRVELERISGGYAKPSLEVAVTAAVRQNQQSITGLNPSGATHFLVSAFPFGTGEAAGPNNAFTLPATTLATATGNVQKVSLSGGSSMPRADVLGFYTPASEYYNGGSLIEVTYDGGVTWWPVVGRQIPAGVGRNWRISNGLVRIKPRFNFNVLLPANSRSYLQIEVWDGTQWETVTDSILRMFDATASTVGYWTFRDPWTLGGSIEAEMLSSDPVVLRNAPDVVTLHIPQASQYSETYTLRRGMPFVEVTMTAPNATTYLGISSPMTTPTTRTATVVQGSGTATIGVTGATDANGNSLILASPRNVIAGGTLSVTSASGTTRLYWGSTPSIMSTFAIGATPNPTGSVHNELETTAVLASIFTAVATTQRVTSR